MSKSKDELEQQWEHWDRIVNQYEKQDGDKDVVILKIKGEDPQQLNQLVNEISNTIHELDPNTKPMNGHVP